MFGNKVLGRIFGPKRTGGWGHLHDEELKTLYSSLFIYFPVALQFLENLGPHLMGAFEIDF
jgi:hypothetical protein